MRIRSAISACLLALTLAALTGCSIAVAPTPTRSVTVNPSASASASPMPIATPAPSHSATSTPTPMADVANPGTWVIAGASVGPISLGQSRGSVNALLSPTYGAPDTVGCVDPSQPVDGVPGVDGWRTSAYLAASFTTVGLISIDMSLGGDASPAGLSPRTPEGIGLGSTVEELTAAYPDITKYGDGESDSLAAVWVLRADDGVWTSFQVTRDSAGAPTNIISRIFVAREALPPYEYC